MAIMNLQQETLSSIIDNISRSFGRSKYIEQEDIRQELWLKALKHDYETKELAGKCLKNFAIDIYKKARTQNTVYDPNVSIDDDFGEIIKKDFGDDGVELENTDFYIDLKDMLSSIRGEDNKKYIVAVCYLRGKFEFLRDQFNQMYDKLSPEEKERFEECEKKTNGISDLEIQDIFCKKRSTGIKRYVVKKVCEFIPSYQKPHCTHARVHIG